MSAHGYGWYYEGGSCCQDECSDLWHILGAAVEEAALDDRLHALLVGEMRDLSVEELLDDEDVISLCEEGRLDAQTICELVSERCSERIWDGNATLRADAKPALRRVIQGHISERDGAADVARWAREYIELDPSRYCDGRNPLPIEYVEGRWVYGDQRADSPEPDAVITYATEPSPETGHVGWVWWARGRMGEAKTLPEAMQRAERALAEVER